MFGKPIEVDTSDLSKGYDGTWYFKRDGKLFKLETSDDGEEKKQLRPCPVCQGRGIQVPNRSQ